MERPQRSSGFRGSWLVVVLASACASPSPVGVDAAATNTADVADVADATDAATIADVARDDALDAAPRPDVQITPDVPDGTTMRGG